MSSSYNFCSCIVNILIGFIFLEFLVLNLHAVFQTYKHINMEGENQSFINLHENTSTKIWVTVINLSGYQSFNNKFVQ